MHQGADAPLLVSVRLRLAELGGWTAGVFHGDGLSTAVGLPPLPARAGVCDGLAASDTGLWPAVRNFCF